MVTKQEIFMIKLKELGGEASSEQMANALDINYNNVGSISRHLERRNMIVKSKKKYGKNHYMCWFKIRNNRSSRRILNITQYPVIK